MVKKIARLFALLLVVSTLAAQGQTGRITGTVTDRATGETLPGASVLVEGTTIGTVTNMDGRFEFSAPAGTITLVASFIGYDSSIREITLPEGGTVAVSFELYADITMLEEFIVIGYGVQKREDATGSVAVVGEADFNRGNITTPSELLMGKMAGVQITSGGGAPGADETIRIRGGSSLSATNDPLVVIDGVPVDNRGIDGMRSTLSTINPNDIETFTVLKDASATAIYGSRASNGVIIITTKKGKEGQALRLSYNGTFSLSSNTQTVDVLGADQFRNLVNERYANSPNVTGWLGNASTDWQDQIYRDAFGHDHSVSATGALMNIPYRASVGYSSHDGVLDTDNMTRVTGAINLSPTFFNDDLKVNLNARGVNVNNTFADNGAIGAAVMFDPTQNVRHSMDSDEITGFFPGFEDFSETTRNLLINNFYGGYYTWIDTVSGLPKPVATTNPVALLQLREDISTVNRFIGNAQLDYRLPFLPELRANLNVAYDYSKSEGEINVPDYAAWSLVRGGQRRIYDQEKRNELIDFYLNYVTDIPALQSSIDVMGGYSWQHFYEEDSAFDTNLENNLGQQLGLNEGYRVFADTENKQELYLLSFFGRVQYNLMDRYLLTFTARNDASSRFAEGNRWGLFPSAAFAWKIKEESFMQNVDVVSELKLRLGWGVTGQQAVGGYYPALPRYTRNIQGAYYYFGDRRISTLRPSGYDLNLKWEETTTYNIGIDYGFANDRFNGSIEFYKRETRDLLNFITIPAGTNLTNAIDTNIGNMENQGVEFTINTRPVVTPDFLWRLGFNATYSETKITKLTISEDPEYLGVFTGGISGGVGNNIQIHSEGFAPNSFFVYQQVYDEDGNPIEGMYVDRNGDGQIDDEDRYHHKKPTADYYLGLNSSFEYKDLTFSFAGRANLGNFMYNNVSSMNGEYSRLHRPEGPYLSNISTSVFDTNFNNARYFSDYYIQDASFFKMDNISVAYNFGNLIPGNTNLTVSFTVQNAFIITKYDGLDPEIANGIDNNFYPRPRNFVLGLNLQL